MKIALITGVGRQDGLGYATAKILGAKGFKVIVTARTLDKISPLAEQLIAEGIDAEAQALDITQDSSVNALVSLLQQKYGKLDVLVNNAAIMSVKPVEGIVTDLEDVKAQLETNFIGTWRVSQSFFALLKASGDARIVNVSSSAGSFWEPSFGLVNNPGLEMMKFGDVPIGSYGLSKLIINGLTLKLAQDFGEHHILVNSVCPGLVSTYPDAPGRPVEEGAQSIAWAALIPSSGPTGQFFRDGKQLPW